MRTLAHVYSESLANVDIIMRTSCSPKLCAEPYCMHGMLFSNETRSLRIRMQPSIAAHASLCMTCSLPKHLSEAAQGHAVTALPASTARGPGLACNATLLTQPTALLASGGEATQLTMLVHWVADPVNAGVLRIKRAWH